MHPMLRDFRGKRSEFGRGVLNCCAYLIFSTFRRECVRLKSSSPERDWRAHRELSVAGRFRPRQRQTKNPDSSPSAALRASAGGSGFHLDAL